MIVEGRGIWVVRDYIALFAPGDILPALMLSQIAYWYLPAKTGKARVTIQRDGVYWMAKSYLDWEEECGFTRMQVRRCLDVLKRMPLIVTQTFMFGRAPTVHLRLLYAEGKSKLLKLPTGAQLQAHVEDIGSQQPIEWLPTANLLVPGNHTYTYPTAESTSHSSGDDQDDQEKSMKIEEILKGKDHHEEIEVGSLWGFWQKRMQTLQGSYQKPLTAKERGQLKQLQKYLGDVQARIVIDYVLNDWGKFAGMVGAETGQTWPQAPSIGFLLKHHAVAMQLLQPIAQTLPPAPMVSSKQTSETPVKDKPHALTKDELSAMIEGLKE